MDNSVKTILTLIFIVIVFVVLHFLQSIVLPLVLAFFVAAMFQPVVNLLRKWKIPMFIILPFIVAISLFVLFGIYMILQSTVSDIIVDSDFLAEKFSQRTTDLFKWANSIFGSRLSFNRIYRDLVNQMDPVWIGQRTSEVFSRLTSFTTFLVMFLLYYVVFLTGLGHHKQFLEYVDNFDPNSRFTNSYEKVQKAINHYLVLKTLLCLAMGVIAYVTCLIFGVKFALFWGFLTFIVSYIPNIGAFISTIFPIIFALITIDSFNLVVLFAIILVGTHMIIGLLIEPIIMGNNMSINTITVIFGLVFWGFMWGIPGMMLSVPLLVVIKLTFEQFPATEIFSRIMGTPKT
ncbi:MAG: hypothetical protein A2X64_01190 [Ignavibacteria bacterium GWF2_33_9]|nr:MAG: hypothetical protein A2X64_01190 [Ignavibacteria bacterium GWF2_33_9]